MKSSVPGYLLSALLGAVVGWGITALRRPAEVLPTPAPRPPVRVEPEAPPPAPPPERPQPEATEAPTAPAPAPKASVWGPPAPPDWQRQLKATQRVKDLLTLAPPPGDAAMKRSCFYARDYRARELLKTEAGQAALLADLPALNPQEMVALWDVLWLSDREKAGGFGAYGGAFARSVSQRLAELIPAQSDPALRMLAANMLLPDTRYLSDREVEYLRAFFQASSDPALQRKAQELPPRGAR
jgi:hypothetical protein